MTIRARLLAALQVAASLLHSRTYRRIAVVASDLASRGLDWSRPEAGLYLGLLLHGGAALQRLLLRRQPR